MVDNGSSCLTHRGGLTMVNDGLHIVDHGQELVYDG